jgi:acyl-CoA thioesterase-1
MRSCLAAVTVALLSCGGRPDPAPEAHAEAAAPPAATGDARPEIIVLGDSIAAGHGIGAARAFPALVQAELDARGYRYRVVNEGVSGETTSGGLTRLPEILERKPAVVIVELGGNDGLRGIPVSATRANLDRMTGEIRAAGAAAVVVAMSLPPNYGPDYVREFEGMYPEVAARHRVPLAKVDAAAFLATPGLLQRDGIHPTVEGHRRIAPAVVEQLVPLLKK